MKRQLPNHPYYKTIEWILVTPLDGLEQSVPDFMACLNKKTTRRQLQRIVDLWVLTGHRTDLAFLGNTTISANPSTWPINKKAFAKSKNSKPQNVIYNKTNFTAMSYEVKNLLDEMYRRKARITLNLVHNLNYTFAFKNPYAVFKYEKIDADYSSYIRQQYGRIAAKNKPFQIPLHEILRRTYDYQAVMQFIKK